ncbi:PolC-type DNA polymerase III N-terminal domain-containing protein, partial [Paenisporosarcina sp.]|uniref:PolC-type DNA polymerase III N-terminal domain-containing protein n=1 Tax=Paenisporosarcina sp. TaxID=1932001 RepID=UPI003C7353EE
MSNEQDAKQRLQLLLQQLELTADEYMTHFESASLSRMTVHKKERVWRFTIEVEKLLPYNMFQLFHMRLREKFAGIADIKLSLTCENPQVEAELIASYWPFVLQEIDDMSPPLRNRLHTQIPSFNGQTVHFTCAQEIEFRTLKSKYAPKIADVYASYGFPVLPIDFKLVEQEAELAAAQQAFMEQRRIEEEELGKKALADMQKRDKDRASNPGATLSGPFQLGIPIKADEPIMEIKQIQDEERRITIEGFVFDVEVKELRSGRSLLTVKVTDYTDSILVKMFSRDKEDAELMG